MSNTATVDTNEGWTFTNVEQADPELPTMTDNNWGIPDNATTTDGWNAPPPAPSPPRSAAGQPRANDHASLHWTACYDDYCGAHRQMKDDNYYPQRGNDRRRHTHRPCSRPHAHPFELAEVIRNRHLNPRKACADWQKGKRVCPDCRFLVNMEDHHQRCQTTAQRTPGPDITPPQEDQEAAGPAEGIPGPATTTLQDEQLGLLGEIVTMIHQTTTQDARRNHVVQRNLAQAMNERYEAEQQQLRRITHTLAEITTEQRRINRHLQARQQGSQAVRIYRTTIRRRAAPTLHDLAGASVWTGDVLSRISHGRLVSAAAGAAVTLAALWFALITAAAATVILRA